MTAHYLAEMIGFAVVGGALGLAVRLAAGPLVRRLQLRRYQ